MLAFQYFMEQDVDRLLGMPTRQSTEDAGEPATSPYTIKHLIATIMNTLFDVGALRIARGVPTDIARVTTNSKPIKELV